MRNWFHRHGPDEPCPHMVALLNREADHSLRGLMKWYVLAHTLRCGPCRRFLDSLSSLVLRSRGIADEDSSAAIDRLSEIAKKAVAGEDSTKA